MYLFERCKYTTYEWCGIKEMGTKMRGNVKKQKPYLCMNIDMAF